jgi:hypothetical protein
LEIALPLLPDLVPDTCYFSFFIPDLIFFGFSLLVLVFLRQAGSDKFRVMFFSAASQPQMGHISFPKITLAPFFIRG